MAKKLAVLLCGKHKSGKSFTHKALLCRSEGIQLKDKPRGYNNIPRTRLLLIKGTAGLDGEYVDALFIIKTPEEPNSNNTIDDYCRETLEDNWTKFKIIICSTHPKNFFNAKKKFFENKGYEVVEQKIDKPQNDSPEKTEKRAEQAAKSIRETIRDWLAQQNR